MPVAQSNCAALWATGSMHCDPWPHGHGNSYAALRAGNDAIRRLAATIFLLTALLAQGATVFANETNFDTKAYEWTSF